MKIGIIVGRFQVPHLHLGHRHLLYQAIKNCDKVFVFIGSTKDGKLTNHDPLPFIARKKMINEEIDSIPLERIYEIVDVGNWELWVKKLDKKIDSLKELGLIDKNDSIYICGSRDSVVDKYKESGGTFDILYLKEIPEESGTKTRNEFLSYFKEENIHWDKNLREAIVWYVNKLTSQ